MTSVCPAGHDSTADDYCDVCGAPIDATAVMPKQEAAPSPIAPGSPAPGTGGQQCPNCGTENVAEALFCESCGYDFTTGSMPRPLAPPDETVVAPATAGSAGPGAAAQASAPGSSSPDAGFSWV